MRNWKITDQAQQKINTDINMGHKKNNRSMDFCRNGKSPIQDTTNLLKHVNEESYNKMSPENKAGFDAAFKKAGGPTKLVPKSATPDKNQNKGSLYDKSPLPFLGAVGKKAGGLMGGLMGGLLDKKTKTYDQAYDGLSAEKKAEYRKKGGGKEGSGRSSFKTEAKDYNKKRYGNTEPTKEAKATVKSKAYSDATNVKEAKAKMVKTQKVKAANKVKTNANDAKGAKQTKAKSDEIKSAKTNPTTKKRSKVGKLATKVGNIFRKNKKNPNRKTKK